MTKVLPFRVLLAISGLCSLVLLPGCPSEPVAPGGDSGVDSGGGGGDTGMHDGGGGGDTGPHDGGGGADTGADGGGGADGGSCNPADCDDMNPCNGVEICEADNSCGPGTALDDGTTCDIDADPATRDLCVGGLCGPSRCGDLFVDSGEECDDGNDVTGDGCDACAFSCATAVDCDDLNVCNGSETCGADHICAAGSSAADGTACTGTFMCMGGMCVPSACTLPADCDNGLRCDGVETCMTMVCGSGTAVDCDDGNDCTADSCAEGGATPCVHTLIDADGDGFSPATLDCGTDCDDTSATVHPGAIDTCGDGIDNDCNGTPDDGGMSVYYADCDGDDYAAFGATGITSCLPPPPAMTGCATGGSWTTRNPATAMDSDCNDANPAVNPGQTVYQTSAIPGAPMTSDFDYDCNSTETRQFTTTGRCMRVGAGCLLTSGWNVAAGAAVPECGIEGTFIDGCTFALVTCTPVTSMRTQGCL